MSYLGSIKRDSLNFGSNTMTLNRKKIKNYSYHSNDRIGKGFSSIVYRGVNDTTSKIPINKVQNETVAVKCIDMKGVKDSISRQMLDCQIEALKTLNHDNILQCLDVLKEVSHCYIITQYCNEGDLGGILKKRTKLSEQDTLKILKDIISGFIQIGQNGFLHRDLKLANIFINNGRAKIADFGFAKKIKQALIDVRNSSERQKYNVGSPLYMSPQALKKNIYSIKNDIWSIGVMAFELLHGETPWECRTEKQLMEKMIRIPVKFRESLNLSNEIKFFIKKCLQVDQYKRMSLQDLKLWLDNPKNFATNQQKQRLTLPPKLNLTYKSNMTSNQSEQIPLSELTNRISGRTQRATSTNQYNKQNRQNIDNKQPSITKQIVDRNNNIVVNEINMFRIIYKISEKLKKLNPKQTQIINTLNSQCLKRVTNLKKCCVDGINLQSLDLKQASIYLDQNKNPSIKKYKSVVSQYFKKYSSQILTTNKNTLNLNEMIKLYLKKSQFESNDEILMCYWMSEFISMPKTVKKQYLDSVIEPKIKLTKQYLKDKIKQIC